MIDVDHFLLSSDLSIATRHQGGRDPYDTPLGTETKRRVECKREKSREEREEKREERRENRPDQS